MANKKFSDFTLKTTPTSGDFLVGYNGVDNIRIDPANLAGYPFLIDTQSLYSGFVPSGLSGNPQGNTVLGISAGNSLTTSSSNTLIGDSAGKSITNSSVQSVIIGKSAGEFKTIGSQSVLVGYEAGKNSSAGANVLVGYQAGLSNTGGNTIAIGENAARSNQSSSHLSIGATAGYSNTTGSGNTNIGHQAGAQITTGSNNTNLGYLAGANVTGNNNVLLGYRAGDDAGAWNNTIIIGHNGVTSPVGQSNFIVLGNSSHTTLQIPGIQSGASNGDVLTYNATLGKLELQTPSAGGATDLNGLSDVVVDLSSDNAFLINTSPYANLTSGTQNLIIGEGAGNALRNQASRNICIGYNAGSINQLGSGGVAIGNSSATTSGGIKNGFVAIGDNSGASDYGVCLGYYANGLAAGGRGIVAISYQAARFNTADYHISIGEQSGYSNTSGASNTNVGYQAGYSNTTGASRVMLGYEAGRNNTGSNNVFLGKATGKGAGSGSQTIAIGQGVMETASQINNSVLIGNYMAANCTSGADSTVAIGTNCLSVSGYSGEANTVVGHQAGNNLSSGDNNTLIGRSAGDSITSGSNLTVIGYDADASSATATNEITLGNASVTSFRIPGIQSGASDGDVLTFNSSAGKLELQAAGGGGASDLNGLSDCLVDTDSLYVGEVPSGLSGNPQGNTVLGIDCGNALTTGTLNTFFGRDAGKSATSALSNTFFGAGAGQSLTTNFNNCLFGVFAGQNITGRDNVGIGNIAFRFGGGDYNVCIGSTAGTGVNSGDYNTMVGTLTDGGSGNNNTLLGNGATRSSNSVNNEITLGNSSIATLRCAVTSITSLSDERDKSEIEDLSYGLAFIDALQPRQFVWDNRPETRIQTDDEGNQTEVEFYSDNKGKKDFGFIAQEVRELDNDTLRLVYTENEDKLEMSYGKLVPILVKAIQELKEEVEILKSQNN